MTDDDRAEFAQVLTGVYAYYRKPCSDFILDVWWHGCQGYELEVVRLALSQHAQDPDRGQFLPMLADVTKVLGGTSTERSAVAWGIVLEAMRSVGAYQDVDFGDAAVHQAIQDLGGWPKLCRTELDELRHVQHRFQQAYQAYNRRGAPGAPLSLMGERSPDDDYTRRGLTPPEPYRILSPLRKVDPTQLLPGPTLAIGV